MEYCFISIFFLTPNVWLLQLNLSKFILNITKRPDVNVTSGKPRENHMTCAPFANLACENIRFSSLFVACDVSRGGTSATQWQKFHTDDANQFNVYIINRVVMGFQIQNCTILSVFWSILVNFCVHLPTSSSKTQILLLEKSIFYKY